jgi:hypothetical protein
MTIRKNEQPKTWFRCERFYRCNEQWFFHTREGIAVGPYRTRFEAEVDAGLLMTKLKDTPIDQTRRAIHEFVLNSGGDFDFVNDPEFTSYLTDEGSRALKHQVV